MEKPQVKKEGLDEETQRMLREIHQGLLWSESFSRYMDELSEKDLEEAVEKARQTSKYKNSIEMIENSEGIFEIKKEKKERKYTIIERLFSRPLYNT